MGTKSHVAILADLQQEAQRIFAMFKIAAKEHGVTDLSWLQNRVVITLVRPDRVERCYIFRVETGHLFLDHGTGRVKPSERTPQLDQIDADVFTEAFESSLEFLLSEHLGR